MAKPATAWRDQDEQAAINLLEEGLSQIDGPAKQKWDLRKSGRAEEAEDIEIPRELSAVVVYVRQR